MACNSPLKGWYSATGGLTFSVKDAYQGQQMEVPCGQCMGCRLAKTASWATRIIHESQLHDDNSFITLTYNDENLPKNQTLILEHVQKFFKRLRKYIEPQKIRYYCSGEYGDITERPHYHAIVFNYWPDDTKLYKTTDYGKLYMSDKLEKIWQHGFVTIGACTYETAAYTASYVTKKITGDKSEAHYNGRLPEFGVMSRRPGIGGDWYEKYKKQTSTQNTVAIRGRETAPPQFYKNKLKEDYPIQSLRNRLDSIGKYPHETDYDRLETTEKYLKKKGQFFAKNNIN